VLFGRESIAWSEQKAQNQLIDALWLGNEFGNKIREGEMQNFAQDKAHLTQFDNFCCFNLFWNTENQDETAYYISRNDKQTMTRMKMTSGRDTEAKLSGAPLTAFMPEIGSQRKESTSSPLLSMV